MHRTDGDSEPRFLLTLPIGTRIPSALLSSSLNLSLYLKLMETFTGWIGAEKLLTYLEPLLASKTDKRGYYHETQTVDSNGRGLNPSTQNGIKHLLYVILKDTVHCSVHNTCSFNNGVIMLTM